MKYSEFARLAGVTRPAISVAIQKGKKLEKAVVNSRIDIESTAAQEYLSDHQVSLVPEIANKTSHQLVQQTTSIIQDDSISNHDGIILPEDFRMLPAHEGDVSKYEKMTLQELVGIFGSQEEFRTWLMSFKTIVEVKERQIKTAQSLGELIPRDFVDTHIIGLIDSSNIRLLTDAPKSIAQTAISMIESGTNLEELADRISTILSSQIKHTKSKAMKSLANV